MRWNGVTMCGIYRKSVPLMRNEQTGRSTEGSHWNADTWDITHKEPRNCDHDQADIVGRIRPLPKARQRTQKSRFTSNIQKLPASIVSDIGSHNAKAVPRKTNKIILR